MTELLLVVNFVVLALVLILGFFVLGALRALGVLAWRLDQLEVTRPARSGRDGLKVGTKAPHFVLPSTTGGEVSLRDFAGCQVLLVFTQTGCGPCHDIAPELNQVQARGKTQVLVVNNGESDETRKWATEFGSRFPVLQQGKFSISKQYQIFATPFAFLIDEQGIIISSGIVGSSQYLGYVLAGAGNRDRKHHDEPERDSTVEPASDKSSFSKEHSHA